MFVEGVWSFALWSLKNEYRNLKSHRSWRRRKA